MSQNRFHIIYLLLLTFSQVILLIGLKSGLSEFIVFGLVFLVLTLFAFSRRLGVSLIAVTLAGMVFGGLLGWFGARLFPESILDMMGSISGALIGAFGGLIVVLSIGGQKDFLAHLVADQFPLSLQRLLAGIYIGAMLLGAMFGALNLRNLLPPYLGKEGSGAFISSFVGVVLSLYVFLVIGKNIPVDDE